MSDNMDIKRKYGLFISVFLWAGCFCMGYAETEWKPVSFGGAAEVGQLVAGTYYQDKTGASADMNFDNRLGVAMTHHAIVNNKLDLQVGVGGLFFFVYPFDGTGVYHNLTPKFGPGVSKAQATLFFDDVESGTTFLRMGFFPIKYNRDAMNLGEYLYRSKPYPSLVVTGGWSTVNSAGIMGLGALFHWENLDGALTHDVTFLMEHEYWPYNDFSPGYVATYKKGMFEIGAGAVFHHLISPDSDRLSPEDNPENHLMTFSYLPPLPYFSSGSDSVVHPGGANVQLTESEFNSLNTKTNYMDALDTGGLAYNNVTQEIVLVSDAAYTPGTHTIIQKKDSYFNYSGIKLMGRFGLDFSDLLGADMGLFGELAVLGVKNYDYYYENITERMPLMLGAHLPTFGILNKLSVQWEYWNSPHPNSSKESIYKFSPVPAQIGEEVTTKDNVSWSVYARRDIIPGLRLFAQVASDHYRPIYIVNTGVLPVDLPTTSVSTEWYYMLRLEFGI